MALIGKILYIILERHFCVESSHFANYIRDMPHIWCHNSNKSGRLVPQCHSSPLEEQPIGTSSFHIEAARRDFNPFLFVASRSSPLRWRCLSCNHFSLEVAYSFPPRESKTRSLNTCHFLYSRKIPRCCAAVNLAISSKPRTPVVWTH